MKQVKQSAQAGINCVPCPLCYNPNKDQNYFAFVPITLWGLAKIRVWGSDVYRAQCNNPNHAHQFDVLFVSIHKPILDEKRTFGKMWKRRGKR